MRSAGSPAAGNPLPGRRIAVTGVGVVSPCGWGREPFWRALLAGTCAIGEPKRFPTEGHRTRLVAEVPEAPPETASAIPEWDGLGAADRFAVAAAREAVEHARIDPADHLLGVYFGGSTAGMREAESFYGAIVNGGRRRVRSLAAHPLNSPGDSVARHLHARGPVESCSSACASGALAIELAAESLIEHEVEIALAGGSDALCQLTYAGFNALRAVDARPCRPFRADRGGLSLGEGAAVLVLERWEEAIDRGAAPIAALVGWGGSCDAHHMTAPHPEGVGAAAAMRRALEAGGIDASAIAFLNAHGTGTRLNDRSEWEALRSVFGPSRVRGLPVTATKACVGHLLGSSGAIEAVATVLALAGRAIPPTAGRGPRDPETPVDLVCGDPRPLADQAYALSTSFAFGGANAALLFESAE